MRKLKTNYLLTGVVALLLALALWPAISWIEQADNKVAEIQSRGELRVSTIHSPLTWNQQGEKTSGLDYELAQQFADYLGVKLKVTVRQSIKQVFDDLDNGDADMLAAGLVSDNERSKHYRQGPTFYSVSQQLVYRSGTSRPRSLANINQQQLTVASGMSVLNQLQTLKEKRYPDLSWRTDDERNSNHLLRQVVDGEVAYTIADSMAIAIFQRSNPRLAVALDITDEQPVTWFSQLNNDDSLSAAMLDFFNNINEDGTLARIEEKYLGHVGEFDYVDIRTFLNAVDNTLPDIQPLFEKYATNFDWRLLAAISYQESHWDPQATSPTGVRGLMMLTRNTAQSLGVVDRLDPEESIGGGARYLQHLMERVPQSIPPDERIWFALTAYNIGFAHMLDARALTARQKGNPDSWADVKTHLPLLSQKNWYSKTTYGYARGHEAYTYVENIRKYQQSLTGYLQEKDRRVAMNAQLAQNYPVVSAGELEATSYGSLLSALFSPAGDAEKNRSAFLHNLPPERR